MKKILIALTLLCSTLTYSQNIGDIDTSFGIDGTYEYTLTIDDVLHGITFSDIYLLPDNKFLTVGTANWGCSSTSYFSGIVMRINPDGFVDETFNNQGYLLFPQNSFHQIIPISNGFFLVSGNGILKIDPNGNLDDTYGNDGIGTLSMLHASAALGSDGSLYVSGSRSSGTLRLIGKLNPSGFVDTDFGDNGEIILPNNQPITSLETDSNDNLFVIGREFISYPDTKIVVKKWGSDGVPDSSFGDNGVFAYSTSYNSYGNKLYLNADGTILGAGYGTLTSNSGLGMILFRLLPNGTLDSTFKDGGITSISVSSDSSPKNIHSVENGFIISGTGFNNMFAIKVDENGNQDLNFGVNGKILTSTFSWTGYNASSVLMDNSIIFCGNSAFAHCSQQKYKGILTKYFVSETLSIDDYSGSKFEPYPNPVKDILYIPTTNKEHFSHKIYAINGKELKTNYQGNSYDDSIQVDISHFAKGVYILIVEDGKERKIKKIMKE